MAARHYFLTVAAATALASATAMAQQETDAPMTFFVTGEPHSGNLGGLAGADATCQRLAAEAGAGDRVWRAYLSTYGTTTEPAVYARDRIGNGGMAIVLVKPCVKLFALPRTLLMPLIIPLCVVGAFAINLNYFDVYVMLGAGLVGFLLDRFGFPLAPMVLGVILGPLADENLRRALLVFEGQPAWSLITDHPIGSVLIVIVLFTFYDGIFRRGR